MNVPFFIAKRYIFSKSNAGSVNFITAVSTIAITFSSAALLTILSIFSGFEELNIKLLSSANPEIKIRAKEGKIIQNPELLIQTLKENKNVINFSKVIEEKVYISYQDKEHIAYIKGIDEDYNKVVRIDTTMLTGLFKDIFTEKTIVVSDGVARSLQLYLDNRTPAKLMVPKPGEGLITSETEDFNRIYAFTSGVFYLSDNTNQQVLSSLELAQELLEIPNQFYSIELKTNPNVSPDLVKQEILSKVGSDYIIETRQEQDAAFLKLMNIENLMSYLIFTLIIIIASFNLAGAIVIIILDKQKQIQSLWSIGLNRINIKRVFFMVGISITLLSILFGLMIGSLICFLQYQFGFVAAAPGVAFPVRFTVKNYLAVILTVGIIGSFISYLVSRKLSL